MVARTRKNVCDLSTGSEYFGSGTSWHQKPWLGRGMEGAVCSGMDLRIVGIQNTKLVRN